MNDLWKIAIGIVAGVAACKIYDDYMEQKELENCYSCSSGDTTDDLPEDCTAGPESCDASAAGGNEPENKPANA